LTTTKAKLFLISLAKPCPSPEGDKGGEQNPKTHYNTMTKKHFIKLADIMRGRKPNPENTQAHSPMRDYVTGRLAEWEMMRDELANFFQSQNPNFNKQLWLDYIEGKCGPSGGKIQK